MGDAWVISSWVRRSADVWHEAILNRKQCCIVTKLKWRYCKITKLSLNVVWVLDWWVQKKNVPRSVLGISGFCSVSTVALWGFDLGLVFFFFYCWILSRMLGSVNDSWSTDLFFQTSSVLWAGEFLAEQISLIHLKVILCFFSWNWFNLEKLYTTETWR